MASTLAFPTGLTTPYEWFTRAPSYVNSNAMTLASSAASLTIPAGMQFVRISANQDIFVKWGSTGASTAAATDGSASEFVAYQSGGVLRNISSSLGTTAISVISTAAACTVTQAWWTV